jgi:hypothetical protein
MHYEAFQKNSISQEQFTEVKIFKDGFIPDPNKKKQFIRWQHLQLKKECHEGMKEIEAKKEQSKDPRELMKEKIEKWQNNSIDNDTKDNNKDIEWEYDEVKEVTAEDVKNRKRWNSCTKEEAFLWGYETIFNWLDINFDSHHKEQFWKTINYDLSHDQVQKYEIRLRQIMENEVNGRTFKWWNEASRRARRKRTSRFQRDMFI